MLKQSDLQDINSLTTAELKTEVKRLGKVANTRLRALESKGYQGSSYAYKKVESELKGGASYLRKDKKDRPAYRIDVAHMSQSELRKEATKLRGFIFTSQTSTVGGIKKLYNKRLAAFNATTGLQLALDEFTDIMENLNTHSLYNMYGSDVFTMTKEFMDNGLTVEQINDIFARERERQRGLAQVRKALDKKVDMLQSQDSPLTDDFDSIF